MFFVFVKSMKTETVHVFVFVKSMTTELELVQNARSPTSFGLPANFATSFSICSPHECGHRNENDGHFRRE